MGIKRFDNYVSEIWRARALILCFQINESFESKQDKKYFLVHDRDCFLEFL